MQRSSYLPSLDGLRGLAILLVIAHNAQMLDISKQNLLGKLTLYGLDFGWVGVVIFFVLSGFLITGILLDAVGKAHALRDFMARRALRIFPLYYGALVLIFVLLPLVGAQPVIYKAEAPYQVWLWSYLFNWTLPLGIGPGALPHFWSLCVEEQFYLLWPLLVLGLRAPARVAMACILVAVLALLSKMALLHAGYPREVLYTWTICRIDALAIGGLAAACWRIPSWATFVRAQGSKLAAGVVLLLLAGTAWTHGFPRTSERSMLLGYSVLAAAFAAVIYVAASRDTDCATGALWMRALRLPGLRSVGKYSYGMYVFHKPLHDLFSAKVLAVLGLAVVGPLSACLHVAGVALASYLAAALSYHLYEVHFLRLKRYFA